MSFQIKFSTLFFIYAPYTLFHLVPIIRRLRNIHTCMYMRSDILHCNAFHRLLAYAY